MNLPGTTIHKLIDNLTRSPFSFALYRLPWTDEPILVLQEEEDVEVLNSPAALNGKRRICHDSFSSNRRISGSPYTPG